LHIEAILEEPMPLQLDLKRALRSHADLASLVQAVHDAPQTETEKHWLEWKSALELGTKHATATIARAVLGFANRAPETAARTTDGCAYLLVGVEPGAAAGVTHIDIAQLEGQLRPYVGVGPTWSADYVSCGGVEVLVITVEAPRQGDPPHPVRKTLTVEAPTGKERVALQDGNVLVRREASTHVASAVEIDMLYQRAARDRDQSIDVDLELRPGEITWVEVGPEAVRDYVESRRANLLAPLEGIQRTLRSPTMAMAYGTEMRREDSYRASVDDYCERLEAVLAEVAAARAVKQGIGVLDLRLVNNTERAFSSVLVELHLKLADLSVIEWDGELEEPELPDPPPLWGTFGRDRAGMMWGGAGFGRRRPISVRPIRAPVVVEKPDHVRVGFGDVDLRPRRELRLWPVWLQFSGVRPAAIAAEWSATALDAERDSAGSFRIPVASEGVPLATVMAGAHEENEGEDQE
jgi:hypothetical protein